MTQWLFFLPLIFGNHTEGKTVGNTKNDSEDASSFQDLPIAFIASRHLILVQAEFFDGRIDLKALVSEFAGHRTLSDDPLILEFSQDAYLVAYKFGGLVFWNFPDNLLKSAISKIKALPGVGQLDERVSDKLVLSAGAPEDRVSFRKLYLRQVSVEHMKVISAAITKSVGLESFELSVSEALQRAEPLIAALKKAGGLLGTEREILKTVGYTLNVRQAILTSLALFDDPPETWSSETLSRLHEDLYAHFELKERASAIEQKLSFLNDLNMLMVDLLGTRQSHRLEWIVIALIVFEVAFSLFEYFSRN
jgi:required for meiotic nuclear division protein 1